MPSSASNLPIGEIIEVDRLIFDCFNIIARLYMIVLLHSLVHVFVRINIYKIILYDFKCRETK